MAPTTEPITSAAAEWDRYRVLIEANREQIETIIAEASARLEGEWAHLDHASDDQFEAWKLVEKKAGKSGKLDNVDPLLIEAANAASKRWETVNRRINRLEVTIAQAKRRLLELDDPTVIAQQEQKRAKLEALKAAPRETARDQGVPDVYLTKSGSFKPGFDAKLKSDLVNSVLGLPTKLMTFPEEEARELLRRRGWVKYLTAARTRRGRKPKQAADEPKIPATKKKGRK